MKYPALSPLAGISRAVVAATLLLCHSTPGQITRNSSSPFPNEDNDPLASSRQNNSPFFSPDDKNPPVVFFPPPTPVYGRRIALSDTQTFTFNGRAIDAPEGLGNYVGEYFYPPLSTRLAAKKLDRKTARRLEAYWANRRVLLNELQNVLVSLQVVDPATRERELQTFAVAQTPLLSAHEKEGEALREVLVHGSGLSSTSVDWSQDREWKLGGNNPPPAAFTATAEAQVVRAAAFYAPGLAVEQRGLLCEISAQEPNAAFPARFRNRTPEDPNSIFFSPETARLQLPELPPDLSAKIAGYVREKTALKQELRAAVIANDAASEGKRHDAFRQLAERQWPRISSLATQAEEIRRDLAALPAPLPPPLPPKIPPALTARIEECRAERRALEQARIAYHQTASRQVLHDSVAPGAAPSPAQRSEQSARRLSALRESNETFLRENAARFAALEAKLAQLSAALDHFAKTTPDPITGDPLDAKVLLARITASERYFDQLAREDVLYKNYRVAMLEPGLSSEQRRLLLNAAREELAQALPSGKLFPRGRIPLPF